MLGVWLPLILETWCGICQTKITHLREVQYVWNLTHLAKSQLLATPCHLRKSYSNSRRHEQTTKNRKDLPLYHNSVLRVIRSYIVWNVIRRPSYMGSRCEVWWYVIEKFQFHCHPANSSLSSKRFCASSSRKLGREQKKEWRGRGRGKKEPLPLPPFFFSLPLITRLGTLATQAS